MVEKFNHRFTNYELILHSAKENHKNLTLSLTLFVHYGVWPAALQAHQASISPERLQALGQEHIIVAQEQTLSDQVYSIYILFFFFY